MGVLVCLNVMYVAIRPIVQLFSSADPPSRSNIGGKVEAESWVEITIEAAGCLSRQGLETPHQKGAFPSRFFQFFRFFPPIPPHLVSTSCSWPSSHIQNSACDNPKVIYEYNKYKVMRIAASKYSTHTNHLRAFWLHSESGCR